MNRLTISLISIAALGCGGAANAKVTDSRVTAALACAGIADPTARLSCYDAAINNLKEAVDTGTLVAERTVGDPTGFEGVIKSSGGRGYKKFGVLLENGDRWEIFADTANDELPRKGAKVKFKKSPAGGYWFDEPGVPDRKARFLGRSTT